VGRAVEHVAGFKRFESAFGGSLGSNLTGAIGNYSGTLSKSGNDLVLIVAVPEPGTWLFLAAGCLAMIAYRRSSGSKLQ
jgi:hypothetical protein